MLYRIQSVALSCVVLVMCYFKMSLAEALWISRIDEHVLADLPTTFLGKYYIPTVCSCVLSWSIISLALCTIFKYNNRILQLKLIIAIGVLLITLILVIGIVRVNIYKVDLTCAVWYNVIKDVFWLFLALWANIFAGFKVYQDHCLVQDNSLR